MAAHQNGIKHLTLLVALLIEPSFACTIRPIEDSKENIVIKKYKNSENVVEAIALITKDIKKNPAESFGLESQEITWLIVDSWKGSIAPGQVITTITPKYSSLCLGSYETPYPLQILYLKGVENEPLTFPRSYLGSLSEKSILNRLNQNVTPYLSISEIYPQPKPTKPIPISGYEPLRIAVSTRKNAEGDIGYNATIAPNGKVVDVQIVMVAASGSEYLEAETIKLVKEIKFIRATLEGKPVESNYNGKISWRPPQDN